MLDFIIKGLATWRISNMLVNESGPNDFILDMRQRTGIIYYSDNTPCTWPSWNPLTCVWCTSIWVALLVWKLPKVVSYIGALSAIACVLDSLTDYLDSRE